MRNANRFVLLLVISCLSASAQEVKFIDLVGVTQRTELRHPPAPPSNCEEKKPCVEAGGAESALPTAQPIGVIRTPSEFICSAYRRQRFAAGNPFKPSFGS